MNIHYVYKEKLKKKNSELANEKNDSGNRRN